MNSSILSIYILLCNNSNCRYCPKLNHSGIVKNTSTKHMYIVPQRITCKFNNLIYLITCKVCQSQYVGQTMNSIQMRFQKHLNDISHCMDWSKAPPVNVGLHFAQRGHSASNILINVLEFLKHDPKLPDTLVWRESREKFGMYRLKSLKPFGINATDSSNHVRRRHNRSHKDQPRYPQT